MSEPTLPQILDLPMSENDADAETVRGYLIELLAAVWQEQEAFSGKRPFGNSSWCYELYLPLAKAGYVQATFDEDGYLDDMSGDEQRKADLLIATAIRYLGEADAA